MLKLYFIEYTKGNAAGVEVTDFSAYKTEKKSILMKHI